MYAVKEMLNSKIKGFKQWGEYMLVQLICQIKALKLIKSVIL